MSSPIAASCATYRKAVNGIAEALDQEPNHSRLPRLDFEVALDSIPEALKQKAIEWYILGIKRGMAKATDLMAEQKIYVEDGTVYSPKTIKMRVRTKVGGGEWERRKIVIQSDEIGFANHG